MAQTRVRIDTSLIDDWDSFHSVFAKEFGFPDFYGRNMNAWIDCMTSLDQPEEGMSRVCTSPGGMVVIELINADGFAGRCPDIYDAILECSAFVNWRRMEMKEDAVLAISCFQRCN